MGLSARNTISLEGDKALIRALEELPRAVQKRVVRGAGNAGAGVIKRATKTEIEASGAVDTGALAKSIVVKKVRRKMMWVVGPRWKTSYYRKTKKGTWRGVAAKSLAKHRAKGTTVVKRNPGAYAHLVELGRKRRGLLRRVAKSIASGRIAGKSSNMRGRGCFRRAFDKSAPAAQNKIAGKIREGLHREARRLAR